jgi:hypothetical protein
MLSRRDPVDLTRREGGDSFPLLPGARGNHDPSSAALHGASPVPGRHGTRSDIDSAARKFAAQDYLDLQVLFNLSWFGFAAREEDPEIRKLVRKGRFYTVEDRD